MSTERGRPDQERLDTGGLEGGHWSPEGKCWEASPGIRSLGPGREVGSSVPQAPTHSNHDVPHVRELLRMQKGRQLLPSGH